jgi:hypothetical protein
MEMNEMIAGKMEKIATIFQDARKLAKEQRDLNKLVKALENTDQEFISVSYEGASMEIAQLDFVENPDLQNWFTFLNISEKHAAQIYIGLGWAIAAEKKTDLSFLNKADQGMTFRMWDGCGYFDAKLRQRQVIKGLARLDYIPAKNFKPYDQGLGRCIWYNSLGVPTKASETISTFPVERHPDLWRGLGVACSYVGGCDENSLRSLLTLAGTNRSQLSIGAAMVAKSRILAGSVTEDIEKTCNVFGNLSAKKAMEITEKADSEAGNSFDKWLTIMERELTNASATSATNSN